MRGTYTLVLVCKKRFRTRIGKLGYANVEQGYYLYTGSALGEGAVSLEGRLNRHLRASKKRRWHVDYLTANQRHCLVSAAITIESTKHLECSVNRAIARRLCVRPILPHAGSSDCACEGHLMKVITPVKKKQILRALMGIYRVSGERVRVYSSIGVRSRGLFPIGSDTRRERF